MKNQDQDNKNNNLNNPTVACDPQALVEDLPISGEQEERVIGGMVTSGHKFALERHFDSRQSSEMESAANWTRATQSH